MRASKTIYYGEYVVVRGLVLLTEIYSFDLFVNDRSTKPRVLLRIAPMLISDAIHKSVRKKIEKESLMSGLSYFTGPLLSWTLVAVIKNLVREIINCR